MPPPRSHLTRFHYIFAPHSEHRDRIVPAQPQTAAPEQPTEVPAAASCTDSGPKQQPSPIPLPSLPRGPYRLPWATLLRRCSPSTCSPAIAAAASGGWLRLSTKQEARRSPRSLRILACPWTPRTSGRLERRIRSFVGRDRWPTMALTQSLQAGTSKLSKKSFVELSPTDGHRLWPNFNASSEGEEIEK